MAQDFSGGIGASKGKMQGQMDSLRKPAPPKQESKPMGGEEKIHTLTEHSDGSLTSKMHGGAEEQHPDHMHALTHMAHAMTGGDKHHMAHHDGMSVHSHGIHEDGNHQETQQHASSEEAGEGLNQFMGGAEEREGGGQQGEQEPEPAPMGGMA